MLKFSELYAQECARIGAGRIPKIRAISWNNYIEQMSEQDDSQIVFPPAMSEAQLIAYQGSYVAFARISSDGDECLAVLSERRAIA